MGWKSLHASLKATVGMTKFRAVTLKRAIRMGWKVCTAAVRPPVAMTTLEQGQDKPRPQTPTTNAPNPHLLAFPSEANFR